MKGILFNFEDEIGQSHGCNRKFKLDAFQKHIWVTHHPIWK